MSLRSEEAAGDCARLLNSVAYAVGLRVDASKAGPIAYAKFLAENWYALEAQLVLELAFNAYSCRPSFRPVPPGYVIERLEFKELAEGGGGEDEGEGRRPPIPRLPPPSRAKLVVAAVMRPLAGGGEPLWQCFVATQRGTVTAGERTLPLYEVYPCTPAEARVAMELLGIAAEEQPQAASEQ